MANGAIYYLGGGYGDSQSTVYVLRRGANNWSRVQPMMQRRGFFSAAVIGHKIYVFGGENYRNGREQSILNQCEYLDTTYNARNWEWCPSMLEARAKTAAVEYRGKIYVFGGLTKRGVSNRAEEYDPVTRRWYHLPGMPVARLKPAAAVLNDLIYVTAGLDSNNRNCKSVDVFDPRRGMWRMSPYMPPTNLAHHTAPMIAYKNALYIAGGQDNSRVEKFDPYNRRWTILPNSMFDPIVYAYANVVI
ncbi:hypothetical protein Ciccas_008015 [Cichlidogyrus casuarinus]|uniref:Uncharacterized protein n=1 Tax=Cichlidogyrus casuarinus TaxID=1844966 RepID=A0ABD2Q1A5_9PLAT